MNKSELVAAIAEKAEMSKKDAEKALKAKSRLPVRDVSPEKTLKRVISEVFSI